MGDLLRFPIERTERDDSDKSALELAREILGLRGSSLILPDEEESEEDPFERALRYMRRLESDRARGLPPQRREDD